MIIPLRNEEGNVSEIWSKLEDFESVEEFIFIEGGSSDQTFSVLETFLREDPRKNVKVMQQSSRGKFNAVFEAAIEARTEHIGIWDSDMSIDVEDQNSLISAYLHSDGHEKFATANRLNPQMHDSAMRFLNKIGNHLFARMVKISLGVNVPDALAGSKIFPRRILVNDYNCDACISMDPFGDLFLLSQIRKHDLKLVIISCEYKARTYGSTNIPRWSGGAAMVKFLLHVGMSGCSRPSSNSL
jgi:glycosyltransferase involved in cell wall biosynthesis